MNLSAPAQERVDWRGLVMTYIQGLVIFYGYTYKSKSCVKMDDQHDYHWISCNNTCGTYPISSMYQQFEVIESHHSILDL